MAAAVADTKTLFCEAPDTRNIVFLLKSISISTRAWFTFSEAGIRVSVEAGHTVQAVAYLSSAIFTTYKYIKPAEEEADITIQVQLSAVLQSFEIFGNASTSTSKENSKFRKSSRRSTLALDEDEEHEEEEVLRPPTGKEKQKVAFQMSYASTGHPLVILLEESGIVTRCELTTFEPEEMLDINFDDANAYQKLIMRSQWLSDAFAEIDGGCDRVQFSFHPAASAGNKSKKTARFKIEAHGGNDVSSMEFPYEKEYIELFECTRNAVNSYAYNAIKHCTKALSGSTKTSIRTDNDGLLSMQFMMPLVSPKGAGAVHKDQENGFIEFLLLPRQIE